MGSVDNILAKLEKYHGKVKRIEVENDDGVRESWPIYPLPTKYLTKFLKMQRITESAPTKNVDGKEVPDTDKLSDEDRATLMEMNIDLVSTTLAFSQCVEEGLLDYKNFDKGTPDRIIETVKNAVSNMSAPNLQKFMEAIGDSNEVPVGEPKKEEVSLQKSSDKK